MSSKSLRCLALGLIIAACYAIEGLPYPSSKETLAALLVVEDAGRSQEELLCIDSLAGNLARVSPRLYRVARKSWDSDDTQEGIDDYANWLRDLRDHHEIAVNASLIGRSFKNVIEEVLARNAGEIKGFIRCNSGDASVSAALTFAAAGEGLIIAANDAVAEALAEAGLRLVRDLRGATVHDVLDEALHSLSDRVVVFQDTAKKYMANLGDYVIFSRAAAMQFGSDERAQARILGRMRGPAAGLGWGPENDFVSTLNKHGVYVHASDWCKNVAALANAPSVDWAKHKLPATANSGMSKEQPSESVHTVAFVMSDGDNLQWMLGGWAFDQKYWGSPRRGELPMGWTLAPGMTWLAPTALAEILRSRSAVDELVAGPSGVGYAFPQTWPSDLRKDFASLTFDSMGKAGMRLANVLGQDDAAPGLSSLAPLLDSDVVDGIIYYGWGEGYASLRGQTWWVSGKPIISGRLSLWGEGTSGQMLGVQPMIEALKKQVKDASTPAGYSIVPVHAWSHNYTDVLTIAEALRKEGGFNVVLPSELFRRFRENVRPATVTCSCSHADQPSPLNGYTCDDPLKNTYCATTQRCAVEGQWTYPSSGHWASICRPGMESNAALFL